MVLVLLTGCSVFSKDVDFPDLTLKYGEELQLPTEVDTGIKSETVEYSFSGSSISIENGILRALVAETVTVVTAKYGSNEAQFKVTVLLGDANNDTPPVGDGGNTDGEIEDEGSTDDGGNTDDGNTEVDKGIMIIDAPDSIYSNYSGKEIKITFSKPEYASEVTFTTDNKNVSVKDGKISATGLFESEISVKVTATSEHHDPQTFTVKVSSYQGSVNAENTVLFYEENIIKEENKGGMIFIGDSYFSGQLKNGKPSFWSDFYEDYADEKAFLLGISSAQIHDLEIVSERIVYPMNPSEIVIHIGFNDVHHGALMVEQLYARIIALCEEYREKLPKTKIYFIGVEPKKNGYTQGTDYYISSTVKAPALTEMIKDYANTRDWFTYVDTMSVFVDAYGNIKQDSYLSTDLSHPTLEAYDQIRTILNAAREAQNAPDDGDTGDTPIVDPDDGTQPEPDEPIDYGTLTLEPPAYIYSNYPAKEIKTIYSKPEYASDIVYTTDNENVFVENGKIYATGTFASAVTVTVTATTENHGTHTFSVKVSTYNGGVSAESKVQYYENNIIKPENKGGTIFVGDSYFDGVPNGTGSPPFWADFYYDYQNEEKIFLMGISSSQIDDLEVVSERIVYPMEPKEIVVHIGFNDVHHGNLTVDELYSRITALCEQYKERLPDVKVYFIGVEPKKNGYKTTDQYYNSSTVKAPALTAKIKEYAESKDWFTYVETLQIFTDGTTITTDSYLHCDLSHPSLHAYDAIRAAINAARGVENYVPDDVVYINDCGVGTAIASTGKKYTKADGSALTDNYIISGKLTIADILANGSSSNAHLQFKFSGTHRFLLWDSNHDGILGVGYHISGGDMKNDTTTGAVKYDVKKTRFNLDWDIVVNEGKAYLYINGEFMECLDTPTLEYFQIGATQMDIQFYGITLTVKSENETAYAEKLAKYDTENTAPDTPEVEDISSLVINSYGVSTDINGSGKNYTAANGSALTDNYVIRGKLSITRINKSNAHLQFRFSDNYRFLLWDHDNDGKFGAGYIIKGSPSINVNDTTAGVTIFDANNGLTLDWAVAVNNGKAYWYINGTLMATFDSPTLSYFNIGALQIDVTFSEIELVVKSEDSAAYSELISEYGIS